MQTFLPLPDFVESAKVLDYRRLGKQRVECKQILNALDGLSSSWRNHPAVLMWEGYEFQLCQYAVIICEEWIRRGYVDNLLGFFKAKKYPVCQLPPWFGGDIHASHRSNLLRKKKEYYSQFNWKEPDNLPYVWPWKI